MINSDYAQYWSWGMTNHKDDDVKSDIKKDPPEPVQSEDKSNSEKPLVKKGVTLPKWLSHKKGKAKL